MDPRSSREEPNPSDHYVVSGPSEEASARGGSSAGGGGLYLDAYEVSFPLDESVERPQAYHASHGPRMVDEGVVQEPPPSPYSPFILVSNLRAHLYVALEKNAWLQKRIDELEEERNFLRCQLDRFIVNMRAQDDWCMDPQRSVKVQPDSSPSPPSPMTTRSGMTLKRLQGGGARIRHRTPEYHLEEEKFYTEDEFVEEAEEEEEDLSLEKGSKKSRGRTSGEPRMKMRRIFRITHGRERQRVKDPDGVLIRYKKILVTYQRVRSMSRAFQIHGVDRNTMASTSPIAELLLVAPEKMAEVGEFEASKEKLLDYARRCYKTMDEETHSRVQSMKKTHKLLPISYRTQKGGLVSNGASEEEVFLVAILDTHCSQTSKESDRENSGKLQVSITGLLCLHCSALPLSLFQIVSSTSNSAAGGATASSTNFTAPFLHTKHYRPCFKKILAKRSVLRSERAGGWCPGAAATKDARIVYKHPGQ
ncbi:hypothetical protein WMY93_020162 [Mugilogobius chulae]|uniref:Coiled-coil domain containing 106b n=1 Tax=Mugilogobius chulae TaxID=88201 RepID=A0AAW0NKK9_9GOBI